LYQVYGFVGNATTRLQGELTILILKNCKARVKISLRSTPLNEYGALLKSIYVAINADTKIPTPGAASNKSTVNISMLDGGSNHNCNPGSGCLLLELHGTDISALRAVLNSYLWLIDASINAYSASIAASS
jgi:tRNA threonylcarbamoyladenosine modification (KEOPS) complex  Pcc1 subunit